MQTLLADTYTGSKQGQLLASNRLQLTGSDVCESDVCDPHLLMQYHMLIRLPQQSL